MNVLGIFGHDRHAFPGHPESPDRIRWITSYVHVSKWSSDEDPELLLRVHDSGYVEKIKNAQETFFLDPDTYVTPHTYSVALRAFTAAYRANEDTFILTRPPGHHAHKDHGAGFCIFNNAVAAALSFLDTGEKVGILDLDAHHGNGTESLVLGTEIPYASIHMGSGYPGTGHISRENILNLPVFHPISGEEYIRLVRKALEHLSSVDVLVVSLGFDTLRSDPLTYFSLEVNDFFHVGRLLREYALKIVLEGGYSLEMGRAAAAFLDGLES